ncbi:KTSC domain-containing protein [Rouxiella chamberiensis]|uniref:KTSC domain-containing protein n=1 Tax=Rouxiella chamberiensis TaxID=1513468 RepID=A0ABY7HUY5_9GAMM|nr:KTSC domain-containing protein [Rouxiella chamberiensis]WAT02859.1 KTSC domain-containing protein [Rouxiella chamberiensis]
MVCNQHITSKLRSICYNPGLHTLNVIFSEGEAYQYVAVPCYMHAELMKTDRKEEFIEQHIKNVFVSRALDQPLPMR